MENKKKEIIEKMIGILNDKQIAELSNVLAEVLVEQTETDNKKQNEDMLNQFLSAKTLEGASVKTIEQYKRTVTQMMNFVGKDMDRVTTNDLRCYLAHYEESRNVSKVTIDNTRRYISSFFSWCFDEDIISKNPTKRIKPIKYQKTVKEPFTDKQLEEIRQNCDTLRNRCLVEFLYSTGCRVSEVSNTDWENVDVDNRTVVVTGKGNKQRIVYISDKAAYWIEKYKISVENPSGALFVAKHGGRLQKSGIESVLKTIESKTDLENVYPHRFRRTLATNLINKGMNIQYVKEILGHEKIETTMIYSKADEKNIKESHRKYIS